MSLQSWSAPWKYILRCLPPKLSSYNFDVGLLLYIYIICAHFLMINNSWNCFSVSTEDERNQKIETTMMQWKCVCTCKYKTYNNIIRKKYLQTFLFHATISQFVYEFRWSWWWRRLHTKYNSGSFPSPHHHHHHHINFKWHLTTNRDSTTHPFCVYGVWWNA